MNDPFELLAVTLRKKEHRVALRGFKADMDRFCGALCFSRNWHHPMLWSHYADKHRGICLGFDVPGEMALPITYNATLLEHDLERQLSKKTRDEKLGLKLMTTKYNGWKYEDEVRLMVKLEEAEKDTGLYFYDFGSELRLKRVIVGARSSLGRAEIEAALAPEEKGVPIIHARLAFKSFRVVRNRAK